MALRNNKSEDNGLSITTHYAIEILESEGDIHPSQNAIERVEALLRKISDGAIKAQKLINNMPRIKNIGKALLIEDDPLYAYAHAKLLAYLGFHVERAEKYINAQNQDFESYSLIVLTDSPDLITAIKIMHCIKAIQKTIEPKIFIFAKAITLQSYTKYLDEGAEQIFKKPIFFGEIRDALRNIGFPIINPQGDVHADTYSKD